MQALPQELPTTRAHGPLVEIVVPVHNEQQALEASVERLHEYLVSSFPFAFRITPAGLCGACFGAAFSPRSDAPPWLRITASGLSCMERCFRARTSGAFAAM